MTPSIGRIVRYVSRGGPDGTAEVETGEHRPAIITSVSSGTDGPDDVTLVVFTLLGAHSCDGAFVEYDEDVRSPGTWHWPERVE